MIVRNNPIPFHKEDYYNQNKKVVIMVQKDILKDKNKLLMAIPILLGVLFISVFFIYEPKNATKIKGNSPTNAWLEPQSEVAKKAKNKIEAYKQDELEEQAKKRIQEESRVRGSDFYFVMQNRNEEYDQATLQRIKRMQQDPYTEIMTEYKEDGKGQFSKKLEEQLNNLEDEQALDEIIREARKNTRIRKELEEAEKYRNRTYKQMENSKDSSHIKEQQPISKILTDSTTTNTPIYISANGKRARRQRPSLPQNSRLIKACIHGDQTIVSGSSVRMRLLETISISGTKIPKNTLFYGTATIGANRLEIAVNNLMVDHSINPVSFLVFDNDAMEGLNLPNNIKAAAAKRMQQGLVQNIDMPLSSIGTMTSEVTSAINATTQIAKQILNMSLSQTKVHLKSNYMMYIQQESEESKLRRKAIQKELQKLYSQMEQENEKGKSHPLKTLIDKL